MPGEGGNVGNVESFSNFERASNGFQLDPALAAIVSRKADCV